MTALAPAFHSVDHIAGLNLNHRKGCWVQYDSESRESLLNWLFDNCEEFHEMQVVRFAKYVGTMIGPDGHIHRWTTLRKKFIQCVLKINASTKSLVERLCDLMIYAVSVLSYIGSICAPDKATLKAEAHALQCTTAGPYNAISLVYSVWVPCVALVLIWLEFILSASRPLSNCRVFEHAQPRT